MQVMRIELGRDQRINLGDYESMAPTVAITVELEPGDDPEQVRSQLRSMVAQAYHEEAVAVAGETIQRRKKLVATGSVTIKPEDEARAVATLGYHKEQLSRILG